MLDPRNMARNLVMFLVEIGTVLTAIVAIQSIATGASLGLIVYQVALAALLFLTVLFANFAEALAEARGKAQSDSLRATRADTPAMRLRAADDSSGEVISSTKLRAGDFVAIVAGQIIPTDGEVVRGVAMNSGTQAANEAGNMIDRDSDPTKLIEVVEIGKQLLMTRRALTTFSIANDLAKYFAVIPAMFIGILPELGGLDVMGLAKPGGAYSAILSAVIFNAIIIPLLIPIALKGVKYRPVGAGALLRRNLLFYGLGGVIAPFIGIKLIDIMIDPLLGLVGTK